MDKFESKGYWWLPENKERVVAGVLRCDPSDEIVLELIGSFSNVRELKFDSHPKIILGIAEGQKPITLFDCLTWKLQMSSFARVSYKAFGVVIGHHFEKKEDIQFFKFKLSYSHVDEWVNRKVFEIEERFRSDQVLEGHTVKYKMPEKQSWQVAGYSVSLLPSYHHDVDLFKEMRLSSSFYLSIESTVEVPLEGFFEKLNYLVQNFLSLAIGYPVQPLRIEANSYAAKENSSNDKDNYCDLEILYRHRPPTSDTGTVQGNTMLFMFDDLKDNFGDVLTNWFVKEENLRPIYDLYFAVLRSPKIFHNHHFLNLAQAVESYHRRVLGGSYIEDWKESPHYKHLLDSIPSEIRDDGFKESLRNKMQYLNEYSLKKRLEGVFDRCGSTASSFIPNPRVFITDVVNTRNYLTHFTEELREKAKFGQDLWVLTRQLRHLLEVCLMLEIAIPAVKIVQLVKRNENIKGVAT